MEQKIAENSHKTSKKRSLLAEISITILIFVIYVLSGKLGLKLAFVNASVTAVWAPTGIALAAFLLLGYNIWYVIFIGAFVINLTTTWDLASSFCIAGGNTLEGLAGAFLVNKFALGKNAFEKPQTIFFYVLFAGIISPVISATIGTTSLSLLGLAEWTKYFIIWLTWWLGDAGGALLIAPFIIIWIIHHKLNWSFKKFSEAVLLLIFLLLISFLEFTDFSITQHYPFSYLLIPPFIWLAFRFSERIVLTYALILSVIAIWGTHFGFGPFIVNSSIDSLLFLQSFIIILTIISISLSSLISERKRVESALIESHIMMEEKVNDRTSELNNLVHALQWEIDRKKTTQKELEKKNALLKLLQDILFEANRSVSINEILSYTINRICEFTSSSIGHVYLTEKNNVLMPTKIWNYGINKRYSKFVEITENTPINIYEGFPGKIYNLKKPIWIQNLKNEFNSPRIDFAINENIKSYFGFPVLAQHEVAGVLEFFTNSENKADENLLEILNNIGTQIGRVVERVRNIEKIKENETKFRTVTETAMDGIITINCDGYISKINKSAERIFGYSESEIRNKPISMLMPDSQITNYHTGFDKYKKNGISNIIGKTIEVKGKRKDGEEFSIELSVSQWESNNEIYYTGILRDVTNRKNAEEHLRISEKQLKDAQQMAHIGSFEWDILNNRMTWSDELYRIFALFPFEVNTTLEGFLEHFHYEDRENVKLLIKESYKTSSSFNLEERILLPDGMPRYIQMRGEFILDERGSVSKLVGVCQDITEIKENEIKLKEAQSELMHSEKLASLGRFSSAIAHEIRNPLANISALSQLVSKAEVDEKLKKHLKYIMVNSDIANKIIKDMLNFASPEDLVLSYENSGEILNNIIESIKPRCNENKIKIIRDIDENMPCMNIDRLKLENALLNFISNSIDAMPDGGTLTIGSSENPRINMLLIDIIDTGVGISKENLDKIFEPFFTTKETGTGLGMGLAYQTIKLHEGSLSISSNPRQGTHIKIQIPINSNKNNGKNTNN